jgi:GT2 family glycosyltransferase
VKPLPVLSVVIPASDARSTLAAALAAVEASAAPGDDVIVARNGHGPAVARNRGAAEARGEILVFVDSDVRVHPDALGRIRAAFAHDPGLTALFGAYDDDPACRHTVSQFRNLLHHHVHRRAAGEATTFWSGLGAIRREAFEASGGFDAELHPHAMEDVELGMRLSDAGARIVLDSELRGQHLKRWTLFEMVRCDLLHRGVPWVRLLLRRREPSSALNLAWRHRITALLHVGTAAAAGTGRRRLAGALLLAAVVLNRDFYVLLVRCGGLRLGSAGVLLHLVHHLTAVASVPVGVAGHLLEVVRR